MLKGYEGPTKDTGHGPWLFETGISTVHALLSVGSTVQDTHPSRVIPRV